MNFFNLSLHNQLLLLTALVTTTMGIPISRPAADYASFSPSTATYATTPASQATSSPEALMPTNSTHLLNGGYWPSWKTHLSDVCLDISSLSHVNYAFATIDDDGSLSVDNEDSLRAWVHQKKLYPELRVFLAVGGGHESAGEQFAAIAADGTKVNHFVASTKAIVEQLELDGIDIDWEYPSTSDQGQQFLSLLTKLRQAMPQPTKISTALPAGEWILQQIPLAELAEQVDFLNLMAYDFVGASFANVFLTGHQAKLFSAGTTGANGAAAVDYITSQGFPANKILFGVPLYGRSFGGANWVNEKFSGTGGTSEYWVKDLPRPGMKEFYDSDAVAVFAVGDGQFVTYDNAQSVKEKAKWVRSHGLAGLFFWQLTADRCGEQSLINAGLEGLSVAEM